MVKNAKKSSYDDLETDYFDEEVGSSLLSLMSLAVAFLAVAAFIALAWYAYQDDGMGEDGEMETIYAQEGDIRNAPEGESGWQFPDTDRQVYRLGSGDVEDMEVEQILPQPERPAPREVVEAAEEPKEEVQGWINKEAAETAEIGLTDAERQKLAVGAVDKAEANTTQVIDAIESGTNTVEKAVQETAQEVAKVIPAAPAKPEPVVEEKQKPVVKKKEAPKKPAKATLTRNRLQLGAFGSRSEALKNWGKIQGRNSSLLGSKRAHVEVAEVNGKTYYRVHAYPFGSKSKADALCVMLKSRGQACFAVKR